MIESAIKTKLTIKPLIGFLMHSDFWEGPCRAGIKENMMPAAEKAAAEKKFAELKAELAALSPNVEVLEPLMVPYLETLTVDPGIIAAIETDLGRTDLFLAMNYRVPKLERYRKTIVTLSNGNEGADISAYCRSIGVEAYNALDAKDLNEILHLLWVRKAVSKTRALVLTQGQSPTYGVQSNIRDLESVRARFGFEVVKLPFKDIFPYMDRVDEEEAKKTAEEITAKSLENRVKPEFLLSDVKYYLAAKAMMEFYGCNAFSTTCIELCASRIPQERKFVPCLTHTLLKTEGYPSGCEEDMNALLAMTVMMYSANRPAFMGNPFMESDEIISLHHSVPGLCMNGFGTADMPYKIYAFTGQGFGAKVQIDFAGSGETEVTLGRFNPAGDTMVVTKGTVVKSEFRDTYCSPYYYIKLSDAREFIHTLADFGHHQCLVFGDQTALFGKVAGMMGFKVREGCPR